MATELLLDIEVALPILNSFQMIQPIRKRITVKLLLCDQFRDHQKAVAEEKGSLNATKVHHTKQ